MLLSSRKVPDWWVNLPPAPQKLREVMHMSDFELLSLVLAVIGLVISAFKLGSKR